MQQSRQLPDMSGQNIAFIGAGNMTASLISGLIADGYDPKCIVASDLDAEKVANLSARFGIKSASDNIQAITKAHVVVMAVKPQVLQQVAEGLARDLASRKPLVISIAAGIREADLQHWMGGNVALVRTMPNTPAMIQAGATVLHANEAVSPEQRDLAESIMRAVGLTRWVNDEAQLDAVTALSGSGPAYFFLMMEAMEQAGIKMGLSNETARLLTLQTALGAAKMAIESRDGPATLRTQVTSPGGTTERALQTLSEGGLPELINQALNDARERSIKLSKLLGDN